MSNLPRPETLKGRHTVRCLMVWLLSIMILIASPPALFGEEIRIEYQTYRYDQSSDVHFYQQPRVEREGVTISGALAEYSKESNIMMITGNVIIYSEQMILTAEKADIDFNTSVYTVYDASFFDQKNASYGSAEKIEQVTEDKFIMYEAEITTCKPTEKAWHLSSDKIVYQVDNFAYALGSVMRFYAVPIFITPFISWPTKEERSSGFLMPELSYEESSDKTKSYWHRLKIPYFLALDRDHDLTLTADLIQLRGPALDLNYQYAFFEGMQGQLLGWYLDESVKDRDLEMENLGDLDASDEEVDPRPIRHKYQFNHKQKVPLGGTLTLEQYQLSDNEINKEYFGSTGDLTTQFKQAADLSYSIPNGSFSVEYSTSAGFLEESVYDRDTNANTTANPHPSVAVNQQYSTVFGTPVSLTLNGNWTNYERVYGWNSQNYTSSIKATSPFSVDFLNIRPSLKRTYYRYHPSYSYRSGSDVSDDIEEQIEAFGWKVDEKEVEFNFEVFRYFANKNDIRYGKLSIVPRIIYSEIEDVEQSRPSGFSPASSRYSKRELIYQIDTVLKVKDLDSSDIRNFFNLSLIQPFDLNSVNCAEKPDDSPVYCVDRHPGNPEVEIGEQKLPLRINFILSPTGSLSGGLYFRYHHQLNRIVETRISLKANYLSGGSFTVSYNDNTQSYRDLDNGNHPEAKVYSVSNAFPISDRLSFSISGKWDQARAKPGIRYADSGKVKRLDRVLTDLTSTLIYKHGCYNISATYAEAIKSRPVGSREEEYIDRTLMMTLSIPLVPYSSSSNVSQVSYQEEYEL